MNFLFFNFYGATVLVESDWCEVLYFLQKDFSAFETKNDKAQSIFLKLKCYKKNPAKIKFEKKRIRLKTKNSITYQYANIRYNDYYGKLLSIFDYSTESAELYSLNLDKMHEITYLLILSRTGKRLDLHSLHKLHSFAISYKGIAFVCMMPSGGGKSTLLLELLKNENIKMISDDTPLINQKGELLSFPIKIGIKSLNAIHFEISDKEKNIYKMSREHYGEKYFISTDGIKNKIEVAGTKFKTVFVAEAFRSTGFNTKIKRVGNSKIIIGLFKHGIIGVGLPIILEYFWEFGLWDFMKKICIFFRRLFNFINFSFRHRKYHLYLGSNSEIAAKKIIDLMERTSNLR